jgi:hypothetical protein
MSSSIDIAPMMPESLEILIFVRTAEMLGYGYRATLESGLRGWAVYRIRVKGQEELDPGAKKVRMTPNGTA